MRAFGVERVDDELADGTVLIGGRAESERCERRAGSHLSIAWA